MNFHKFAASRKGGIDVRIQNDSDQAAEIQRLMESLTEMETALNEHYCDIGKRLLEMAEKEDREINQLVDQIVQTRRQLTILQKRVRCASCLAYNSPDSRYCCQCGKKLCGKDETCERS